MLVAQSCSALCNPMDCSQPCFSVHGILQARILEWVAIPFSRGSSQTRDQTRASLIAGRFFIVQATGKPTCFKQPDYDVSSYSLYICFLCLRFFEVVWSVNLLFSSNLGEKLMKIILKLLL